MVPRPGPPSQVSPVARPAHRRAEAHEWPCRWPRLLLGLRTPVLAPPRRSQRPAHAGPAVLPGRFRRRLARLERKPGADGRTPGCLARRRGEAQDPPPPGAVRAPYRPTTLRRTKRGQGAVGLAFALGASRGGKEEGRMQSAECRICQARPAAEGNCATLLGYSPGMRRACAVTAPGWERGHHPSRITHHASRTAPAPASQTVSKEGHRHIPPRESAFPPAPNATLLGPPPYHHHTHSGAMPVAGAVPPPHRQQWVAPILVHCPYPPQRPLS